MAKFRLLLQILLLVLSSALVGGSVVREKNGGNCIGTRSCRPRCMTFRLHRDGNETGCHSRSGIFQAQEQMAVTAWREPKANCSESEMGNSDVLIRVDEESSHWSLATEIELSSGEEEFTFCSIYPCPKTDCALPEQMV